MANLSQTLVRISRDRAADPLAPVTVIVPSHLAGLQMRKRLGQLGPFAAVRFEILPRLAEGIAAGDMASRGRSPLARPIGDYVAGEVALRSRAELSEVRELPGFGRVLRQMFGRLRRGGIARPEQVKLHLTNGYLGELLWLYGEFRGLTASFYDEEDVMEAAAALLRDGRAPVLADLGAIYLAPPGALSAGADALLRVLRRAARRFVVIDETAPRAAQSFVLAPDPASEVRNAVREVLARLDSGAGLHEVAVFHGADRSYSRLLREAFQAARVPAALSVPLMETTAGRAVLLLASLPEEDYSRTAVMDFLAIAPLRPRIPGLPEAVAPRSSAWDRLSRDGGVTRGAGRWRSGLGALIADIEAEIAAHAPDITEGRRSFLQYQLELMQGMSGAIDALIARLEPLRASLPAVDFIARFRAVVDEYLEPDAWALDNVKAEIARLGTIAAVGGTFTLSRFVQALRANLELGAMRERGLGDGVLIADYRAAAGLSFPHVVLCGAFEGSFPAGPGADTLVDDSDWAQLRQDFPYIEDAALRIERSQQAAQRAVAAAETNLTWMAPLFEPGGTREYYPSPAMVEAARGFNPTVTSATALRRAPASVTLRRAPSPLAASLRGLPVDLGEASLRQSLAGLQAGVRVGPGHRLWAAVNMLRQRRSLAFTEFEGNLGAMSEDRRAPPRRSSPTALESYGACGFKYFAHYLLGIRAVEEPEERDVMEPAERGSLLHEVLDEFFKEKQAQGRPRPGETWGHADLVRLLQIGEQRLQQAKVRGKTGLDVFAAHDARTVLADLAAFLEADNVFRVETGAIPAKFEEYIPSFEIAGTEIRGVVDRIDLTPDGKSAWVIDYKTGSWFPFRAVENGDEPLAGGTKLQLPAYVAAAQGAERIEALYWFISRQGGFRRISYEPTAQNQERFHATVAAIIAAARQGVFPAVPGEEDERYSSWENCKFCDFTRICSMRRDYDFQLKKEDPAMRPWWRVGAAARGEA